MRPLRSDMYLLMILSLGMVYARFLSGSISWCRWPSSTDMGSYGAFKSRTFRVQVPGTPHGWSYTRGKRGKSTPNLSLTLHNICFLKLYYSGEIYTIRMPSERLYMILPRHNILHSVILSLIHDEWRWSSTTGGTLDFFVLLIATRCRRAHFFFSSLGWGGE